MSESEGYVTFPVLKQSMSVNVSSEVLPDTSLRVRFPRRHHVIEHPPTAEEKAEYKAYKRRWKAMEKAREALISEGQKRDWATRDYGYDWEPAELQPLEPRIETVYDETQADWFERLRQIAEHHAKTGEWLEEPEPVSFMDVLARDLASAFEHRVLASLALSPDMRPEEER